MIIFMASIKASVIVFTIFAGIMHFFLPKLFLWDAQLKRCTKDLLNGILIINYMCGICLIAIGLITILDRERGCLWSDCLNGGVLSAVWISRFFLQIFFPQRYFLGKNSNKKLAIIFLGIFILSFSYTITLIFDELRVGC
jgi:hypothetical protein